MKPGVNWPSPSQMPLLCLLLLDPWEQHHSEIRTNWGHNSMFPDPPSWRTWDTHAIHTKAGRQTPFLRDNNSSFHFSLSSLALSSITATLSAAVWKEWHCFIQVCLHPEGEAFWNPSKAVSCGICMFHTAQFQGHSLPCSALGCSFPILKFCHVQFVQLQLIDLFSA